MQQCSGAPQSREAVGPFRPQWSSGLTERCPTAPPTAARSATAVGTRVCVRVCVRACAPRLYVAACACAGVDACAVRVPFPPFFLPFFLFSVIALPLSPVIPWCSGPR